MQEASQGLCHRHGRGTSRDRPGLQAAARLPEIPVSGTSKDRAWDTTTPAHPPVKPEPSPAGLAPLCPSFLLLTPWPNPEGGSSFLKAPPSSSPGWGHGCLPAGPKGVLLGHRSAAAASCQLSSIRA